MKMVGAHFGKEIFFNLLSIWRMHPYVGVCERAYAGLCERAYAGVCERAYAGMCERAYAGVCERAQVIIFAYARICS